MNNNFFEVIRAGINTTFQDKGRFEMQHLGIAPSGCMDYESFLIANKLVQNQENEGVLEFAYQGPLLKLLEGKTKFAVTGNVIFKIIKKNNEVLTGQCNRSYDLEAGDQLDVLATNQSVYGYLSIEGGFKNEKFCKSVSTLTRANIGPNDGKKIDKGDKLLLKENNKKEKNFFTNITKKTKKIIRVLKGPQYNYFSDKSKNEFVSGDFKITNLTDRMGMRLEGVALKNIISTNIRSEGITRGAIQVPADGQPIILLNDHPTIGGYPKIANVISADYDSLIQNTPGTSITFQYIDIKEAELAFKEYIQNIKRTLNDVGVVNEYNL